LCRKYFKIQKKINCLKESGAVEQGRDTEASRSRDRLKDWGIKEQKPDTYLRTQEIRI
jgi:hypothetical protein